MVLIIVCTLAALVAAVLLVLLLASQGKLPELTDIDGKRIEGAINEKGWLEIGGISQGYFLRGEKESNPVLLFLHGGPGSPELPMIIASETAERPEKYFTICYWEQRGAGMTYKSSTPEQSMTVERMVEDTREITQYLIKRFGVSKIYLAGHSWGSYLGIKTIQKYPELYAAYVGIGQVTNQLESELLAYDYLFARATENGDKAALKRLAKFNKNDEDFPSNTYLMQARTPLMNKYGVGFMHKKASMGRLALQILFFGGYTFADKLNYIGGMGFSLTKLFGYVLRDNLFETSADLQVPVYIVQGKYDYQVSHDLAEQYTTALQATQKHFYSFENSAHSPNMEESAQFVQVLKEVLINASSINQYFPN